MSSLLSEPHNVWKLVRPLLLSAPMICLLVIPRTCTFAKTRARNRPGRVPYRMVILSTILFVHPFVPLEYITAAVNPGSRLVQTLRGYSSSSSSATTGTAALSSESVGLTSRSFSAPGAFFTSASSSPSSSSSGSGAASSSSSSSSGSSSSSSSSSSFVRVWRAFFFGAIERHQ